MSSFKQLGLLSVLFFFTLQIAFAQNANVRGHVFDQENGEPIGYAYVLIENSSLGTLTDINGFFSISGVPSGEQVVVCYSLNYDTVKTAVTLTENSIENLKITLAESAVNLATVNISARKEQARTETGISAVQVSPAEIKSLPSTGGDADLVQYLTVLPGVVSGGDQGGQIYIRGGSPVQTKVLLDGMTIYRPFHSIGLYSVFETESIRNVEVLSGGFNADYGGRISAMVDITTKEGNKKKFGGLVGISPFQTRAMLEGPIKKFTEDGSGSVSFMLTGKYSLLDQTSTTLYDYASTSDDGLPFKYSDLYGKLSLVSNNGSSFNVFGFNFNDDVTYQNVADVGWKANGAGINFNVIPPSSNLIFGGNISYSNYDLKFQGNNEKERTNKLSDLNIKMQFNYFGHKDELTYGIDVNVFSTDFEFTNLVGLKIEQEVNNTDIAAFFKYKRLLGRLVLEPGIRFQYYAGLNQFSVEPRFGAKMNVTDQIRLKFGAGLYSQNLVSTVNERDIVNLFVGFLSSPDETLYKPNDFGTEATRQYQSAQHVVAGVELDVTDNLTLNIEPYLKNFTQLISLNRNKLSSSEPNYVTETGLASGIDLSAEYKKKGFRVWGTYSLAKVNRDNGLQEYPANFDRRHNANLLVSQTFGNKNSWTVSGRWNYGTGFPFTLVQGFYGSQDLGGANPDIITSNPDLKPIFSQQLNNGRLPDYHRLDLSIQKRIIFSKYSNLELTASVTNVYDRDNIFYFDILDLDRVNQLPIIPSVGAQFKF